MALFIFFRLSALLLLSMATAMQKKNALVNEKTFNPAYIRLQSL
jgi:hypothetical protein